MSPAYKVVLHSPLGSIGIIFRNNRLAQVDFLGADIVPLPFTRKLDIAAKVSVWFEHYFKSPEQPQSLPLEMEGTPFQRRVWKALLSIPYGQTRTYGELAKQLNTSARAIGMACRENPMPIVIPCHRVVAKSGIGGYCGNVNGQSLERKIWLLRHESQHVKISGRSLHEAKEQAEF